jgi:hypothetical protein
MIYYASRCISFNNRSILAPLAGESSVPALPVHTRDSRPWKLMLRLPIAC